MPSLLSAALVAASLVIPVAEGLPAFPTRATCETGIRAMGIDAGQSVQQCVTDETSARADIEREWAQYQPALRERCVAETQIDGSPSYVEVLECLRIGANKSPQ
ncbi:hypothetical protein [Microvirga pudoricolor]|uniref:hypothetical protein n=1 Tax=Microvirga pudoricolor TaxID=2778729 RepID=UPI0019505B4B|nr:hypothetical protein [Microvirga pudoricolor]MBM6594270.1 hypothetical protein [Microvirga pudoricolor]